MKFLKQVPTITVKRCFVVAQFVRWTKHRKGYLKKTISRGEFQARVAKAQKKVLTLSRVQLDEIIGNKWEGRLQAYNLCQWYLCKVKPTEVGVWKRAGEMPLSWTNDSLADTADHVRRALKSRLKHRKIRAAHDIPGILETSVDIIQSYKYLLPIVLKGGTEKDARHGLKHQMAGDIDDGCMRSIALTVNGAKSILVYFGIPKKTIAA